MNTSTSYQQQFTVNLANESVVVHIQASRRKSMRLGLNAQGEVEVKIPLHLPKKTVLTFLTQNQQWLLEQRQRYQDIQQQRVQQVLWLGNPIALQQAQVSQLTPAEHSWFYPEYWSNDKLLGEVDKYQRQQAYVRYQQMIDRWWPAFAQFGSKPTLRVKKMRTRWGSLSQRGYINLNLVLLSLPEELQELVIVHELCHLKHFDHGAGFKALMRQCLPDVQQREALLRQWEKSGVLLH